MFNFNYDPSLLSFVYHVKKKKNTYTLIDNLLDKRFKVILKIAQMKTNWKVRDQVSNKGRGGLGYIPRPKYYVLYDFTLHFFSAFH